MWLLGRLALDLKAKADFRKDNGLLLRKVLQDVFVRREALQGLQPPSVVVGVDEVGKVSFELIVSIVMIALTAELQTAEGKLLFSPKL
jgi:hypothetical protein